MAVFIPIDTSVGISLPGLQGLQRVTSSPAQRNELLNTWADTYFQFVNARHNLLSAGGSANSTQNWRKLSKATVDSRKKRLKSSKAIKPKRGATAILADTLQLLNATRKRGGPGQVRSLDTTNFVLTAGISGFKVYQDPSSPNRKKNRSLGQLARFHNLTGRPIIVPPTPKVLQRLESQAQVWILKRARNTR